MLLVVTLHLERKVLLLTRISGNFLIIKI
jgi:hypothetical protein